MAGVGDLIALFRCISCRYNFSTTTNAPDLLGAPGRVFATGEVRGVNPIPADPWRTLQCPSTVSRSHLPDVYRSARSSQL